MSNKTILQYFEWYLPSDGKHWNKLRNDAPYLASLGISDVWMPPAYKAYEGMKNVGYAVYDTYDLGEFNQQGTIPTKYGTKDEYLAAIQALHENGMHVMADIVLNHRMGADDTEDLVGRQMSITNRTHELDSHKKLRVWTVFSFPGRDGKYSDFVWNSKHFSAVNYNALTGSAEKFVFKLPGHRASPKVSRENGNYDYLMGADVDFNVPEVLEEVARWGRWYLDFTNVDSLRLDAVKHISSAFFPQWLAMLRRYKNKELFTVGEYWQDSLGELMRYLDVCDHCMSLFDVPLHYRFHKISNNDHNIRLSNILDNTLVKQDPDHAVTFVDNHDTQKDQPLYSWVEGWFKPLAYALILLRKEGTPCVFYGDLYGVPKFNIPKVEELELLLLARRDYAHGHQEDYFDHDNVIGWTRGEYMAVVMSTGDYGWKDMKLGLPGDVYVDMLGHCDNEVTIGVDGKGRFSCQGGSVSVWVPKP